MAISNQNINLRRYNSRRNESFTCTVVTILASSFWIHFPTASPLARNGLTAVACALMLVLLPSNSTAVDRIALYVIPLQLVIASRLPDSRLFGTTPSQLVLFTLSFSIAVEFVWLNFVIHSSGWLPYVNVLFL